MRLKNYINEDVLLADDVFGILKKDCPQTLKILSKSNFAYFIYRASKKTVGTIEKITPRNNRIPKDMPTKLHNLIDNLFKKKFGWKARSVGVFAASQYFNNFNEYGTEYLFFPIGQFKFVWSPEIKDLYEMFDWDTLSYYKGGDVKKEVLYNDYNNYLDLHPGEDMEYDEYIDKHEKIIDNAMKTRINDLVKTYTDKDLTKALEKGHEIMFKCDKYYLVWPNEEIMDKIKEEV